MVNIDIFQSQVNLLYSMSVETYYKMVDIKVLYTSTASQLEGGGCITLPLLPSPSLTALLLEIRNSGCLENNALH